MTDYLYAASGDYIAFRHEGGVFDPAGDWLGWIPSEDEVVFTPDGLYLGEILSGDLFIRKTNPPRYPIPGRPVRPNRPPQPARPARHARRLLPNGYSEL